MVRPSSSGVFDDQGVADLSFQGIVHHVNGQDVLASRGAAILRSNDGGHSWREIARLPAPGVSRLASGLPLPSRLLRAAVHHLLPLSDERIVAFAFGRIHILDSTTGRLLCASPIHGSRPLCIVAQGDFLLYGEYHSNPERQPIRLWVSRDGGCRWEVGASVTGIRHVHGVFRDPVDGSLWLTTGDGDEESALWRGDEGLDFERVVAGSQQARAVQLLFTANHIYFGTDTPREQNSLYRVKRDGSGLERLVDVEGSVFYGCTSAGSLFFSTVCEPSEVNRSRDAVVWGSKDGHRWAQLARFRKDAWPMKLFQYGQVLFPAGPGDPGAVWFTPFATRGHLRSLKVSVESGGLLQAAAPNGPDGIAR